MRPHREFLPEALPEEPLPLVARWLAEAEAADLQPNANAMVLATADAGGAPHARVVLCKELRVRPGYVTFFTHYDSAKGRDLTENPRAAAVMHWDRLNRQVRLEGRIVPTTAGESDAYFASRPWQSRLGAWASRQSKPLGSRGELEGALLAAARQFGTPSPLDADATAPDPGVSIERPPQWGGYHLWIEAVELWVGGDARLHDRARWQRSLTAAATAGAGGIGIGIGTAAPCASGVFDTGPWRSTRLHP
jgi:pyridoxamine 5'-phosphate oxidase